MRPEAKFEAVIEAGRVNLAQKNPNDLKEAAVASKHLGRHPVSNRFQLNLCFWKWFWIWLQRNESEILENTKVFKYVWLLLNEIIAP